MFLKFIKSSKVDNYIQIDCHNVKVKIIINVQVNVSWTKESRMRSTAAVYVGGTKYMYGYA